jgi:hypothetical protein
VQKDRAQLQRQGPKQEAVQQANRQQAGHNQGRQASGLLHNDRGYCVVLKGLLAAAIAPMRPSWRAGYLVTCCLP